jgi:uncharacterized protein YerC
MTKLSRKPVDVEKFGYYVNNLWASFTLMDSKEQTRALFKDLFTNTEYKMFAKRLEIARRLLEGNLYVKIQKDLSVTPTTINSISNILKEKGEGFRNAHDKLSMLESKGLAKHRSMTKNLENPLLKKLKHKTILGQAIKLGISSLDGKISKHLKQRTSRRSLPE